MLRLKNRITLCKNYSKNKAFKTQKKSVKPYTKKSYCFNTSHFRERKIQNKNGAFQSVCLILSSKSGLKKVFSNFRQFISSLNPNNMVWFLNPNMLKSVVTFCLL